MGHDYSLNIANLPIAEPDISIQEEKPRKQKNHLLKTSKTDSTTKWTFDDDPSESEQQGSESEQQGGQP